MGKAMSGAEDIGKPSYRHSYDHFKERLKQPKSLALYESMMKFTKEVQSGTIKVKDLKTTVQQFIAQFEEDFQNLWAESEEDYQNNCEAIEGIITKLLYPKLIVLYDTERDRRLSYLFKVFDFIELSHLEAGPDIDAETFAHAVESILCQCGDILTVERHPKD
eukprot:TRINITY_DN5640_c0_g1_i1.p1 TRINITY_DN5640_c0_g1~~TRINITY_DN5640_c0_g1_i1.p1  ORF type:complete len:163 (+),score=34.54 TRINITY_DN5640_c0_g1_i1:98-586(+)